ncbi:isoaspartyl peptidase/L-asparaginase [Rapidithrix thailandica]|uniref:Isoaspartyl peptidase n=1 Tax=Rapidithrix thailandica TaxID=413964 RepID=A0AAW9S7J9_9BACT
MKRKIALAIHGGAGTLSRSHFSSKKEKAYQLSLQTALQKGYRVLQKGGTAIDAVTEAVVNLEDNELFNAGKGSVFTHDGEHEMDASLMEGKNLKAGAVTSVKLVKNPILLAKAVMLKSKHVFLSGEGAMEFAIGNEIELETKEYFFNELRYKQWLKARSHDHIALDHDIAVTDKKFGTVGAVAIDRRGNLAAATSTGGMTNKRFGRIGDSPVIGSGTYANNQTCAISCTGHGEYFLRLVVAHEISNLMEYAQLSLQEACERVVHQKLSKMGGRGGLIAIDKDSNIQMVFNSKGMYRACLKEGEEAYVGIYKD